MKKNTNSFRERIKYDTSGIDKKVKIILNKLMLYYQPQNQAAYKKHFSDEYSILKQAFPEIDFIYEGRIKNPNSLASKIRKKLLEGHTGNIYDIFAKKIIVYSVNGETDENILIDACHSISEFLINYDSCIQILPEKYKDYITSPKESSYQAIHIVRQHSSPDVLDNGYFSEVQIRTFNMEENQRFGRASHLSSYKPQKVLKRNFCPTFLEIGKTGKTFVLPSDLCWEKYQRDFTALQEMFEDITPNIT